MLRWREPCGADIVWSPGWGNASFLFDGPPHRPPAPSGKSLACENGAMRAPFAVATALFAAVLLVASLLAACSGPPKRDVFIPPYAEKGCWAQFFEQADFGPPMRQVEGPAYVEAIPGSIIELPQLEQIPPRPLFGNVRSLMVGPNAKLVGYTETLFRGTATVVDPGARVPDAAAVGYPGRFSSLTLECKV
jgi:hypothetical protein